MSGGTGFSDYHPSWESREFNQNEYASLIEELANKKPSSAIIAKNHHLEVISPIMRVWQTIKGLFGFENLSDPIKVNYELLKLLRYGEKNRFFSDAQIKILLQKLSETLSKDQRYADIAEIIKNIFESPKEPIGILIDKRVQSYYKDHRTDLHEAFWPDLFHRYIAPVKLNSAALEYNKGLILASEGFYFEALSSVNQALTLSPNQFDWQMTYLEIANKQVTKDAELGRVGEAEALCKKMMVMLNQMVKVTKEPLQLPRIQAEMAKVFVTRCAIQVRLDNLENAAKFLRDGQQVLPSVFLLGAFEALINENEILAPEKSQLGNFYLYLVGEKEGSKIPLLNKAILAFQQTHEIFAQPDNINKLINCHLQICDILLKDEKYLEAERSAQLALNYFYEGKEKFPDKIRPQLLNKLTITFEQIAGIHRQDNKIDDVFRIYELLKTLSANDMELSVRYCLELAKLYVETGNRTAALAELENASKFKPNDAQIIVAIASHHLTDKNYETALNHYLNVHKLTGDITQYIDELIICHRALAGKSLEMGKFQDVLTHYQQVFLMNPAQANQFAAELISAGDKMLANGMPFASSAYRMILPYIAIAIIDNKKRVEIYLHLAKDEKELKTIPQAIEFLLAARKLEPDNIQVLRELADCYKLRGNLKEAQAIFKILSQLEHQTDIFIEQAELHLQQGEFEQALEEYKNAAKLSGQSFQKEILFCLISIAKELEKQHRYKDALDRYRQGAASGQSFTNEICNCLIKLGEEAERKKIYQEALNYYQEAIQEAPSSQKSVLAKRLILLGDNLRIMNQSRLALQAYKSTISYVDPSTLNNDDLTKIYTYLADEARQIPDYPQALAYYKELSTLQPYSHAPLASLAEIYEMQNQLERAADAYQKAHALLPKDLYLNKFISLQLALANQYYPRGIHNPKSIQESIVSLIQGVMKAPYAEDVKKALGFFLKGISPANIELNRLGLYADTPSRIKSEALRACELLESAYDGGFFHLKPEQMDLNLRAEIKRLKELVAHLDPYYVKLQEETNELLNIVQKTPFAEAFQHFKVIPLIQNLEKAEKVENQAKKALTLIEEETLKRPSQVSFALRQQIETLKHLLTQNAWMHLSISKYLSIYEKSPQAFKEICPLIVDAYIKMGDFEHAAYWQEIIKLEFPDAAKRIKIDPNFLAQMSQASVNNQKLQIDRNFQGYIQQGEKAQRIKDYRTAVKCYQQAIIIAPSHRKSDALAHLIGMSDVLLKLGESALAAEVYQTTILHADAQSFSKDHLIQIYTQLAEAAKRQKDFPQATNYYLKLTELDSNNAEIYKTLAELYIDAGQFEKGINSYQKALSIQPENNDYHHRLLALQLHLADYYSVRSIHSPNAVQQTIVSLIETSLNAPYGQEIKQALSSWFGGDLRELTSLGHTEPTPYLIERDGLKAIALLSKVYDGISPRLPPEKMPQELRAGLKKLKEQIDYMREYYLRLQKETNELIDMAQKSPFASVFQKWTPLESMHDLSESSQIESQAKRALLIIEESHQKSGLEIPPALANKMQQLNQFSTPEGWMHKAIAQYLQVFDVSATAFGDHYQQLIEAFVKVGDYANAIHWYEIFKQNAPVKAAQHPLDPKVYANLADSMKKGSKVSNLQIFNGLVHSAEDLIKNKNYSDAISLYKQALGVVDTADQTKDLTDRLIQLAGFLNHINTHDAAVNAYQVALPHINTLGLVPSKISAIYIKAAESARQSGLAELAALYYQQGRNLDQNNAKFAVAQGEFFLQQKDYKNALISFQAAVEIEPNNHNLRQKLTDIHTEIGDQYYLKGAGDIFRQNLLEFVSSIFNSPHFKEIDLVLKSWGISQGANLSDELRSLGNNKNASPQQLEKEATRALQLIKHIYNGQKNHQIPERLPYAIRSKIDQLQLQLDDFHRLAAAIPETMHGIPYTRQMMDEAIVHYLEAGKIQPEGFATHCNKLIDAYFTAGHVLKALTAFENFKKQFPAAPLYINLKAYAMLADIYLNKGENEKAITLITKARTLFPAENKLKHTLSHVYYVVAQKTPPSVFQFQYYELAISCGVDAEPECYDNLADLYIEAIKNGKNIETEEPLTSKEKDNYVAKIDQYLKKAADLDGSNSKNQYKYAAFIYHNVFEMALSFKYFRRALEIDPLNQMYARGVLMALARQHLTPEGFIDHNHPDVMEAHEYLKEIGGSISGPEFDIVDELQSLTVTKKISEQDKIDKLRKVLPNVPQTEAKLKEPPIAVKVKEKPKTKTKTEA